MLLAVRAVPQEPASPRQPDPFDQKVEVLELNHETIGDAIGRIGQLFDVAISVEGVLPESGTTTNSKFRARIEGRSIAEVLTWLCSLDPRYTWARDGSMANLFPRALQGDKTYFFNRVLPVMRFQNARKADEATISVVHQLADPNENLICLGIGGNLNFAKPWTATFRDITVRQALNRIAQQLGPTYGWQIGGTTKQRLIVFYYKPGGRPGTGTTLSLLLD